MPLREIVAKLHAGLPGTARQSLAEVEASVLAADAALSRKLVPDSAAGSDLYVLNDASAAALTPSTRAAERFLARNVVHFGGGRIRGSAHPAAEKKASRL